MDMDDLWLGISEDELFEGELFEGELEPLIDEDSEDELDTYID